MGCRSPNGVRQDARLLDTATLAPNHDGVHPRHRLTSLTVAVGIAIALGAAAVGCGPKNRFCPDAGDGICRPIPEASAPDTYEAPPTEMGSIFIGADAGAG
jgi:hypothetical protein